MSESNLSFQKMADKWRSPYVSRDKVAELTGGILHPRTMANLDCKGQGPPGRIRIGRKVAYDVDALCKWLASRAEEVGKG
jgi:phage terminase Nu1 subunit (DNA packaging protein)